MGERSTIKDWTEDKRWSDKYIKEIKKILGEYLISESPIEEDIHHNTDLMILTLNPYRIACRIRRNYYYKFYPNDITIRNERPNNTETEFAKMMSGWGDFFFYGFSNEQETNLQSWTLLSLDTFRQEYKNGLYTSINKNNTDNSSSFMAFPKNNLKNAIVAESP